MTKRIILLVSLSILLGIACAWGLTVFINKARENAKANQLSEADCVIYVRRNTDGHFEGFVLKDPLAIEQVIAAVRADLKNPRPGSVEDIYSHTQSILVFVNSKTQEVIARYTIAGFIWITTLNDGSGRHKADNIFPILGQILKKEMAEKVTLGKLKEQMPYAVPELLPELWQRKDVNLLKQDIGMHISHAVYKYGILFSGKILTEKELTSSIYDKYTGLGTGTFEASDGVTYDVRFEDGILKEVSPAE